MKYIRTQNGRILEVLDEDKRYYYLDYPNEAGLALWGKFAKDVIKEADTIEELIDVYVCDELIFLSMEQLNHYCYIRNKDVYGAIWTSKGLIYVAKMDKSGELKLL